MIPNISEQSFVRSETFVIAGNANYLPPAPQADPHAEGLSPEPQAEGLSPEPQAVAAVLELSLFQS